MDIGEITKKYIQLREAKTALEAEQKAKLAPIKEMLDKLEGILLAQLQASGLNSANTPYGTPYISKDVSVSVADWQIYWNHAIETGNTDLIKRAASKEAAMLYKEAHGEPPPGLNWREELKILVNTTAKQRSAA